MVQMNRRVSELGLSPREAAFVTGLSEKTINQAIDRAEVEPLPGRRADDRERMLPFPELVYLRLRRDVGLLLSPQGKRKLRQQLGQAAGNPRLPNVVNIGPLQVNFAPELESLQKKLAEMEQMWSFVTIDPEVRAGEPVVRGTRVGIHTLADLAAQGAPAEELLEDYPSLTPESLDAALAWARMYPRRGRPPRAPWKNGVVIRRGS
ncbi:MAG TPA: DUF433 domain-containing protein [Longimicrobium sp.]|nr:DUF433 domain-containing protein [Longimicrobium sp.]